MLTKSWVRRFLKFSIIWTLIAAIFTGLYSTGLYMLYQDGMGSLKVWIIKLYNSYFYYYYIHNHVVWLSIATEMDSNYQYFGKIEDDGSLTDVYKTDYDSFELISSDVLFNVSDAEYEDYYLTVDPDKQGKVVASTYKTKYENQKTETREQRYLSCPEEVLNRIRNSQAKGTLRTKNLLWTDGYFVYPDNGPSEIISTFVRNAAIFVSRHLIHILDDYGEKDLYMLEDESDGAYIYRADVDVDAGKILSGELRINGDGYAFPDKKLTDSTTRLKILLHKRPDSIFEKHKDLLRDSFDQAYLESLQYEPKTDAYDLNNSSLERFTYDCKYEDGQAVISGISKYEDGYYRYVYIIPLAGFWETFTPWIAEPLVLVWLPGLVIGGLFSLVISRKRYV